MRQKHDFSYLIKEYQTQYAIEGHTKGSYADNGELIPGGTSTEQRKGIVLFMGNADLQTATNGTYTRQDVKVMDTKPVELGAVVIYRGNRYKVNEQAPWDEYSDFYIYFCKKVAQ